MLCSDNLLRSILGINAKNKAMLYDKEIVFPKIANYYNSLIKVKLKWNNKCLILKENLYHVRPSKN